MERDQWSFEKTARAKGFRHVAGVDEAGRGPLAGPVVAAAVILPPSFDPDGVTDSKKLTPKKRDALYAKIYKDAVSIGIGMVDPHEIDRVNILRASLAAMAISTENLRPKADFLLIDGNISIPSAIPQRTIVKGDFLSVSISAASIVAKVTRDRMMARYAFEYPGFGFETHKGYPTRAHREVLRRLGPSPIHRLTFKGSLPKTR
jgi:ribonuclease HII